MRAVSIVLVSILVVTASFARLCAASADAEERPQSPPAPEALRIDPAALRAAESRPVTPIPESALMEDAARRPRERRPLARERDWPDSGDLNDTAPFLYGSTYVIQIFVNDGGGSWTTRSDNPFDFTRSTQASLVRRATEWIQGKAPYYLYVDFNTSYNDTAWYYNATISGTIGDGSGLEWMTKDVPRAIGFNDADRDSSVLDDMLEYCRTRSGGGWDNVIAIFHLNHSGRSYAYSSDACAALFSKTKVSLFEGSTTARTFAHEIAHLYGASDEYLDGFITGSCADGDCDDDYFNNWLSYDYKNGNCSSCGYDNACLMRWVADNVLSASVSLCADTKKHLGWGDGDNDGVYDCEESPPWAELTARPPTKTGDSSFVAAGFAYTAFRWTHIAAVEYSIDNGPWKNSIPTDDTFDDIIEGFTIDDTIHVDGLHRVRVRAKNQNGTYQASPLDTFSVRIDRTPPAAPLLSASNHGDTTRYYGERQCSFAWYAPFDSSGIAGYSWEFDEHPSTIPAATVKTKNQFADATADRTGVWYLHVRAVDAIGNWGATAHFKAKVDMTPPSAPVITSSTHSPNQYSNKAQIALSWKSTDAHSPVDSYNALWALDRNPTQEVPTYSVTHDSTATLVVPASPDGAYYFHVRARDDAGNWGPTGHFKVLVDKTPPLITASCGDHPNPDAWYIADDANFSWLETAADLSGIYGYSYAESLGYAGVTPDDSLDTGQTSVDLYDLATGTHYFAVQARDNAGNWGSARADGKGIARVAARVDRMPPDTVTNLVSPSHGDAIGQYDCDQSSDKWVDVSWSPASDDHSGIGGYAYVWNHSPTEGPIKWQRLDSTATATTSPWLPDGEDWYFHIRAVDKVGNWADSSATIGPFFIKTSPPPPPEPYAATTGDATVTMRWHPPDGVPAATYKLYRRDKTGMYGTALATDIQDTSYTDSWPSVKNGNVYYYVVTTVDSCGLESEHSYETIAEPEYATPGSGVRWDLADLVDNSKGGIRGASPSFTMHGTVTISGGDTLDIVPGSELTSQDATGTKRLLVQGTLIADGTPAGRIVFSSMTRAGSWGGIELQNPGPASIIDHCTVQYATTGIVWNGGSPLVTNSTIERASAGGVAVAPAPFAACTIDTNMVRWCGGTAISVFASPASTTRVAKNTVHTCGAGTAYDMNPGLPGPALLTVADNSIRRCTGDGIVAGNGAINTFVTNNVVLENRNGIVFDGEGWLVAAPLVQANELSGNRNAGIYTAMQSAPDCWNNIVVQNGQYGCLSTTNAHPKLRGNTITGSAYGVFVQNSPAAVPDLGNPPLGSPGTNRLDGHRLFWVWNAGGVAMNAKNNYWGSAQANPALVCGGPSAVIWNPTWNVQNMPPTIAVLTPNGGAAGDAVNVTWTDADPDPADNAKINLCFDTDAAGLDGTQIGGASNISEDDETDAFAWDTRLVPEGTYWVYALISDHAATTSGYSPGSITIQHANIAVMPDSAHAQLAPDATRNDSLTVHNTGAAALHASLSSSEAWLVLDDTAAVAAPGSTARVHFHWDATGLADGTTHECSIAVASDDHADSLLFVPASLIVATGEIDLSTTAVAFGGVAVDSSRSDTLMISNLGTGDLYVTGLAVDDPFSIKYEPPWDLPDTLRPYEEWPAEIVYAPTRPGVDIDTLVIHSSDTDEPVAYVALSGTGLGPEVRIAEASHSFGTVAVGSSAAWEVWVANDGTAPLVVSSAAFATAGFTLENPALATSIAGDDSLLFMVGFAPAEARDYADTLRLATSDPDEEEIAIALAGSGAMPEAELSREEIAFGGVPLGDSLTDSLLVRNIGEETLLIDSVITDGPFACEWPELPYSLEPWDSVWFFPRFAPVAADSAFGILYIETDSPLSPVLEAALSGVGLAPSFVLVDSLLDFGPIHADSAETLVFRIANAGAAALSVTSLTLSAGTDFALDPPALPLSISPGDTDSIAVMFFPSPEGPYRDTALIGHDDPDLGGGRLPIKAFSVAPQAQIYRVVISGNGVREDNLLPDGFDFGAATLGEKKREVFRLRNAGGYPLTLASLSADPPRFALDDTLSFPFTIEPGAFQPIAVSYRTDSLVAHAGLLSIVTNDRETPTLTVPLEGHGSEAIADVYPGSIDEVVFEGDSLELALHLTNAGENYYSYLVSDTCSWIATSGEIGDAPGYDTVQSAVTLRAGPVGAGVHNGSILVLTDNAGMDSKTIPVRMRVPRMRYADHVANFVGTVTDEGAFGFHDATQAQSYGSGFVYPASGGSNVLFHGSLWVGKDTLHVSDESYCYDFEALPGGALAISGTNPRRSTARFTDAGSASGLHVEVGQECLSYPDAAHDDYLVVNYTIKNVSGAPLAAVYAGIWLDWDIGNYRNNRGGFSRAHETGYLWNPVQTGYPYAGITILSPVKCSSFRLVYNPTYLYPYSQVRDRDKYAFMSSGSIDSTTATTQDWSMVMSAGPFSIAAGDSVRVSFAIVGGATLQALLDNADAARDLAGTPVEPQPLLKRLSLAQCYPNPFNPTTRIDFETPRAGKVQLVIFNVNGEVVARLFDGRLPAGSHSFTWNGRTARGMPAASGVYFYRLSAERSPSLTRKMVLLR